MGLYSSTRREKNQETLLKVLIGFVNLLDELGPASNKVIQQCGPLFTMNYSRLQIWDSKSKSLENTVKNAKAYNVYRKKSGFNQ